MLQVLVSIVASVGLFAAPFQEPAAPAVEKWSARIPQTYQAILFESNSYKPDNTELKRMRKAFGPSAVLYGTLGDSVILSAIASELPSSRISSGDFRKQRSGAAATFEVGDVACCEQIVKQEGIQQISWNAYLIAGKHVVDFHVSTLSMEGVPVGAKFARADFEAFVQTLRVISIRRLGSDDLTQPIKDAMNEALRAVDPGAIFQARVQERPGDPSLLFARAEVMLEFESATDVKVKYCREALAALEKAKDDAIAPPRIRAVAIDGLCIQLQNAEKHAETIPLFEKAIKLAGDTKSLLAPLHYNLACSYARAKNTGKAIAALQQAIANDPEYKKTAAKDSDFEALRKNKDFLALVQ